MRLVLVVSLVIVPLSYRSDCASTLVRDVNPDSPTYGSMVAVIPASSSAPSNSSSSAASSSTAAVPTGTAAHPVSSSPSSTSAVSDDEEKRDPVTGASILDVHHIYHCRKSPEVTPHIPFYLCVFASGPM